jgi:hypothetical protein
MLPIGQTLSTSTDGPGNQWLASGWYGPEPWGNWSDGTTAYLAASFNKPIDKGLSLTVWATAVRGTQKVTVVADGRAIANWDVKEGGPSEYKALIPRLPDSARSLTIEFHVDHPMVPSKLGMSPDSRELGFGLTAFRFDEPK